MSIQEIRSSLNSDDLMKFDKTLSNFSMTDGVSHTILNYENPKNFMVKSTYNSYPTNGIVVFTDGKINDYAFC